MGCQSLVVENLRSSYGGFAIEDVTFELREGDIMGLVGKSGSGKSTLLKALLGLNSRDRGKVILKCDRRGKEVREVSGYSPQENALYPFMSIRENLKVFGRLRNVSSSEIEERGRKLLKELEIYEDRNKRVSKLSGGMRKRADLCTCLLHDPEILIMDEPFSGIDPPQREIIWENLISLADEGKMIMLTSHIIGDLSEKCNRFGLVHNGDFYWTPEIREMMKDTRYKSVEKFLKDSFRV